MRVLLMLAALSLGPSSPAQERAGDSVSLQADLAQLDQPAQAEAAFARLLALGEDAAIAALGDFASASPPSRRARSLLVREVGRAAAIQPALERLDDPDIQVRRNLLHFLARPELRSEQVGPRV